MKVKSKIRLVCAKNREADLHGANETGGAMNVTKAKNIALAISLIAFAIGFSDFRENMFFWMGRPVGAIAFIIFFIFALLEKEYALLDEQERTKFAALNIQTDSIPTAKQSNQETYPPALTAATSH